MTHISASQSKNVGLVNHELDENRVAVLGTKSQMRAFINLRDYLAELNINEPSALWGEGGMATPEIQTVLAVFFGKNVDFCVTAEGLNSLYFDDARPVKGPKTVVATPEMRVYHDEGFASTIPSHFALGPLEKMVPGVVILHIDPESLEKFSSIAASRLVDDRIVDLEERGPANYTSKDLHNILYLPKTKDQESQYDELKVKRHIEIDSNLSSIKYWEVDNFVDDLARLLNRQRIKSREQGTATAEDLCRNGVQSYETKTGSLPAYALHTSKFLTNSWKGFNLDVLTAVRIAELDVHEFKNLAEGVCGPMVSSERYDEGTELNKRYVALQQMALPVYAELRQMGYSHADIDELHHRRPEATKEQIESSFGPNVFINPNQIESQQAQFRLR